MSALTWTSANREFRLFRMDFHARH